MNIDREKAAYFALLQLPLGGVVRHHAQSVMVMLRDRIADAEGRSSEEVQTAFEALANPRS